MPAVKTMKASAKSADDVTAIKAMRAKAHEILTNELGNATMRRQQEKSVGAKRSREYEGQADKMQARLMSSGQARDQKARKIIVHNATEIVR